MPSVVSLYTIGYEGRTIDGFLAELKAVGVDALADVRDLPVSRKKGFSKTQLAVALAKEGIAYHSFRDLGTPHDLRRQVKADGNYASFFIAYRFLLRDRQDALARLASLVTESTVCLMCYEANADRCHRSVIAEELRKPEGEPVEAVHL